MAAVAQKSVFFSQKQVALLTRTTWEARQRVIIGPMKSVTESM